MLVAGVAGLLFGCLVTWPLHVKIVLGLGP